MSSKKIQDNGSGSKSQYIKFNNRGLQALLERATLEALHAMGQMLCKDNNIFSNLPYLCTTFCNDFTESGDLQVSPYHS